MQRHSFHQEKKRGGDDEDERRDGPAERAPDGGVVFGGRGVAFFAEIVGGLVHRVGVAEIQVTDLPRESKSAMSQTKRMQ